MSPNSVHTSPDQRALGPSHERPLLDRRDEERLLDLARTSLLVATRRLPAESLGHAIELAPEAPHAGVFTTLMENGALRGCMGALDPRMSLGRAVARAAILACDDPRFLPLAAHELPDVHVDLSILAPPQSIQGPEQFEPGTDGVIVELAGRRALLLPEVAIHQGWGAEAMFDAVSVKAGLPPGAWRWPETTLWAFRTTRFGGRAVLGRTSGR